MPQLAIDFTAALDARDLGVKRAVDHANSVEAEWSGQALGMLTAYAATRDEPFLIESARRWAEAHGLPKPPDDRAWGSVTRCARSKRHRVIERVEGATATGSINKSPKPLWRRVRPLTPRY